MFNIDDVIIITIASVVIVFCIGALIVAIIRWMHHVEETMYQCEIDHENVEFQQNQIDVLQDLYPKLVERIEKLEGKSWNEDQSPTQQENEESEEVEVPEWVHQCINLIEKTSTTTSEAVKYLKDYFGDKEETR